jgi:hypothetical protein
MDGLYRDCEGLVCQTATLPILYLYYRSRGLCVKLHFAH